MKQALMTMAAIATLLPTAATAKTGDGSAAPTSTDRQTYRATMIRELRNVSFDSCVASHATGVIAFDIQVTVMGSDVTITVIDRAGSTPEFRSCVQSSLKKVVIPHLHAGEVESVVQRVRIKV